MIQHIPEAFIIPLAVSGTLLAAADAPDTLVMTMFGTGITAVSGALVYIWRQQVTLMNQRMQDREEIGKLQEKSLECDRDRVQLHQQLDELKQK